MQISPRRLPPVSALFSDYLEGKPLAQGFYSHRYSIEAIAEFARNRPRADAARLHQLCETLSAQQKQFGSAHEGVDAIAAGAVTVVTGQQPGLFTGPHLSILKALTAVKLARRLEQSGVRAVPVFWIASEDHDHAEIESTWVLNRDAGLCRARVDLSDDVPSPVGWTEYRQDIRQVIADCMACLPKSEFAVEIRELLDSCYAPGKSPVECFGAMMARIFAATPLVLVDPLHPEMKRLAQPILAESVRRNTEIRSSVLKRNQELAQHGYHLQVKVEKDFTGLFAFRGRAREILKPAELSPDLLLSPSALLRPVVQDSMFPTAAYVGGPAEVAYFAQAAAVYEVLQCPMPPIFPRLSATIIEPGVARNLKQYGIEFSEVFEGRDALRRKCASASGNMEIFDRAGRRLQEELESLRETLAATDVTLAEALQTSQRKVRHQVESLRTRYVHATFRRDAILDRRLNHIENSLAPERKMQERVLNVTSFLQRNGMGMIGRLDEMLDLDSRDHQLIEI